MGVAAGEEIVRSDPSFTPPAQVQLLSPPSNWPTCFKEDEVLRYVCLTSVCSVTKPTSSLYPEPARCRRFLGKRGLQSRRCRLVDAALPEDVAVAARAAKVELHPADSFANAMRVKEQLGWDIVKGFAIMEYAECAHQFVAHKRWWNTTALDAWVDLTPTKPTVAEAGVVLAESALAANRTPSAEAIAAEAIAAEQRTADIRKAALAASARNKVDAEAPSYRDKKHEADRRQVMGEWRVHGVKHGRVRIGISPSGRYALEAECWSPAFVDLDTNDEFFEPPDSSDEHYADACQMQVKGNWELMTGFVQFKVNSIETFGPATQYLPLKPEQVPSITRGDIDGSGWIMSVKFNGRSFRFEK